MKNRVKVINLHQPWATLIAIGEKKVETRSWGTNYSGWVAIHANATKAEINGFLADSDMAQTVLVKHEYLIRSTIDPDLVFPNPDKPIPLGAIVAVARLADTRLMGMKYESHPFYNEQEEEFGYWSPERYAWTFMDLVALERPIPYKSSQGFPWLNEGGVDPVRLAQIDALMTSMDKGIRYP